MHGRFFLWGVGGVESAVKLVNKEREKWRASIWTRVLSVRIGDGAVSLHEPRAPVRIGRVAYHLKDLSSVYNEEPRGIRPRDLVKVELERGGAIDRNAGAAAT